MTLTQELPIQLGDPLVHSGIAITPLFPRVDARAHYVTLEDALPLGFRVTEVDAAGAVPELAVHNPTDADVLLYDGEELVGAKQNRILNITVLVAAGSKTLIPVSCVEEGRWAHRSAAFAPARHAAHPELRRRKSALLLAEPMTRGIAQHEVWSEVRSKAEKLRASSITGAHADTYAAREHDLERLRKAFPLAGGQSGALVAIGDAICLDYVSRPEAFARLYPKLLDGYLLDALDVADRATAEMAPFLDRMAAAARSRRPSPGRGNDVRLSGDGVVGSGLELDGELIQLCSFSASRGGATVRLVRPSQRRT
jgi:hypothetical protein